jgi:hypothetical protein
VGAEEIVKGEEKGDTDGEEPDLEGVVLERSQEGRACEGHCIGL